jgi:uncharacterized protein (TIGR00251 family)
MATERGIIQAGHGGVYLDVHVQPGARRTRVMGRHGDALKVAVSAPPVAGRANEAVMRAIIELFAVAPGNVSQVSGHRSRRKRFFIRGIDQAEAIVRLNMVITAPD